MQGGEEEIRGDMKFGDITEFSGIRIVSPEFHGEAKDGFFDGLSGDLAPGSGTRRDLISYLYWLNILNKSIASESSSALRMLDFHLRGKVLRILITLSVSPFVISEFNIRIPSCLSLSLFSSFGLLQEMISFWRANAAG